MTELLSSKAVRQTLFVEVILPLAVPNLFTYRIPYLLNDDVAVGKRVVVQFGRSKIYTAIIAQIGTQAPTAYEAKYIIDIIDDYAVVNAQQMKLWYWIADYYLCTIGDVMSAALPSALKLASETRIVLNSEVEADKSELGDKEYLLLEALEIQNELSLSDISKILGQKVVFPVIKKMLSRKMIFIYEEINEKYKPKKVRFITLSAFYKDKDHLRGLFEVLEKTPKQADALLAYLHLEKNGQKISRSVLAEAAGCSPAVVKTMIDKGVFEVSEEVVSRFSVSEAPVGNDFELSPEQGAALSQLEEEFQKKSVTLLHGVTSSGKTQLYIRLIENYLKEDKQVLYLLPEIALTAQIVARLQAHFGNQIAVYHSKFNDNERAEIWEKVLKNQVKIILGARSSIFLPFTNLGFIVVDEEHEASYKQYDPAPRYNARDAAIVLGQIHEAKVLLGSATPSLESYFNAKNGKYGLVKLMTRYSGVKLPEIEVVSLSEQRKRKTLIDNFSDLLLQRVESTVKQKEQVILFQNRRGYVPILMCRTCGHTPKCINCDVSLTYHKASGKLHCHYCGYKEDNISSCPACGSHHIEYKGFGTEKIEDDLRVAFPDLRIARFDYDTTRNKNAHHQIITDFEERRLDVLVGTQMVAKGLDFESVTLIGVINADTMLQFPDFRAYERSFQMLSQVAGRAGRREKQGHVLIQAYDTNHRIIQQLIKNDYEGMYLEELKERKQFKYPPFFRIIHIDVKHKDFALNQAMAERLGKALKLQLKDLVIGPETPLVSKIRNYYIQTIMVKVDLQTQSLPRIKKYLKDELNRFEADKLNKGALVVINVDPY